MVNVAKAVYQKNQIAFENTSFCRRASVYHMEEMNSDLLV